MEKKVLSVEIGAEQWRELFRLRAGRTVETGRSVSLRSLIEEAIRLLAAEARDGQARGPGLLLSCRDLVRLGPELLGFDPQPVGRGGRGGGSERDPESSPSSPRASEGDLDLVEPRPVHQKGQGERLDVLEEIRCLAKHRAVRTPDPQLKIEMAVVDLEMQCRGRVQLDEEAPDLARRNDILGGPTERESRLGPSRDPSEQHRP